MLSSQVMVRVYKETVFGWQVDEKFMREALSQANRAACIDEVPVGAVVVNSSGIIIGRGYNKVEKKQYQGAHAEMHAIAKAARVVNNWRLTGCWLYVTLEPCVMCIGLIINSRLAGVVYGTASPLFGFQLDNGVASWVYKKDTFVVVHHDMSQAAAVLKDFFKKKRDI